MTGICTVCQQPQPISGGHLHDGDLPENDVEEAEGYPDHPFNFRVLSHDCHGEHCDGSGQVPQVVCSGLTK